MASNPQRVMLAACFEVTPLRFVWCCHAPCARDAMGDAPTKQGISTRARQEFTGRASRETAAEHCLPPPLKQLSPKSLCRGVGVMMLCRQYQFFPLTLSCLCLCFLGYCYHSSVVCGLHSTQPLRPLRASDGCLASGYCGVRREVETSLRR